jgi:hypothetical protein
VIDERKSHEEKDCWPNLSTEEGIQIDESLEQHEKAESSIHDRCEPDSNVTAARDPHL